MTSIHFDPAQFGPPSEPEPRDQLIVNGRYYLPPIDDPTGKRRSLQRVTNFVKQLADQGGLTTWKLRMAVIGLARDERRYDLACSLNPDSPRGKQDLDKLIEECIDLGQAGPSGGNITGTALHNYTDDVAGSYPIRVRDKWVPKLENYQLALHDKGLRVVPGLQERLVVSERYGTCGRLDDVYEDPFGTLRVGDRKSQKEFHTWWEIGAQLALYQCSDAMWNEAECRWEDMPALADDVAHVAWMPLKHPAAKKGGSVDTVTIYDLPLDGPREVLEYCARVRELRTGARKWGQERPDLDGFARFARDIRDAETHDDLRSLAGEIPALTIEGDPLNRMAAKRWEAIEAEPGSEPAATPLNDAVHVVATSSAIYQDTGANVALDNGQVVPSHAITLPASPEMRAHSERLTARVAAVPPGPWPAEAVSFDPALFVGPEQDAITGGVDQVPAAGGSAEALKTPREWAAEWDMHIVDPCGWSATSTLGEKDFAAPITRDEFGIRMRQSSCQQLKLVREAEAARSQRESTEPRPELGMSAGWIDGEGALRKPMEWAAHLQLGDAFRIQADGDGVWYKPMPLKSFQSVYAAEIAAAKAPLADPAYLDHAIAAIEVVTQARPIEHMADHPHPGAVKFTHSKHENATTVHLPGDGPIASSANDRDAAIEALGSVPIKIVREVRDRAHNSKSSRGRVRLLNDVEENKYAAHGVELLPALLREWLVIDGDPSDGSEGAAGDVRNTEGSKRKGMSADFAGRVSLSEYLELKEGAPAGQGDDIQLRDSVDISKAVTLSSGTDATQVAGKVQEFADTVAEVRKPYAGLSEGPNAGKHTIARLIELAKDARNGAERARVFHAITKYHKWTGEIAAEINQHYLDNGYATEDFGPYFEAKVIDGFVAPGPPVDPNEPSTVDDAIHLLKSVTTLAALQKMWGELGQRPYFHDARLQEALMKAFAVAKA